MSDENNIGNYKNKDNIIKNNRNVENQMISINQPRISSSKSNDLSQIDSSILSFKNSFSENSKNSQLENITERFNRISSNFCKGKIIDLNVDLNIENQIEEKKDSNFSSDKDLFDEMNKAEKYYCENKKYFLFFCFIIFF